MGISKDQLEISMDITKEYILNEISPLELKVSDISIAQKTVNNSLDYFYGRPNGITVPILNQNIIFIRKDGNIISTNGKIPLKPRRSYEFTVILAYVETSTYADIQYKLMAGNIEIALFAPYRGSGQYEYPYTCNCIYTNNTSESVDFEIIVNKINTNDKILDTLSSLTVKEVGHYTTIDPVEYVNTNSGIEDAPVGHIMSFMGTTAPNHYLACDGSIYNITTYPVLSQFIKDQFGSINKFGGDGTTTFAVPDLRDEFLRGYHGDKTEKLSGEIGVHQDSTEHLNFQMSPDTVLFMTGGYHVQLAAKQTDKILVSDNNQGWTNPTKGSGWSGSGTTRYTSRPTNTAVLYCIKYEPTYFMSIKGLVERTSLWEGNVGNNVASQIRSSINLADSIMNYDMIEFQYTASLTDGAIRPQCRLFPPEQIKAVMDSLNTKMSISLTWGYYNITDYTDILCSSTVTRLDLAQQTSYLNKVVGIKYKTFQN